ncbi:hypothetical protein CJJ23_02060 [Mycoplasmopsis agassizii]|uniref:Uncharacterized protein n=1 Tax=Mycoplasmopsis agassizii TaxID=33922 RepID=A0A269TIV1_9BACT|nr:hypothetical protein [Mycoplasmopsis agassizii]PAK21412.1 hypothetical protein CJJ23_02060 [Mycoplasmopsis agassizii]
MKKSKKIGLLFLSATTLVSAVSVVAISANLNQINSTNFQEVSEDDGDTSDPKDGDGEGETSGKYENSSDNADSSSSTSNSENTASGECNTESGSADGDSNTATSSEEKDSTDTVNPKNPDEIEGGSSSSGDDSDNSDSASTGSGEQSDPNGSTGETSGSNSGENQGNSSSGTSSEESNANENSKRDLDYTNLSLDQKITKFLSHLNSALKTRYESIKSSFPTSKEQTAEWNFTYLLYNLSLEDSAHYKSFKDKLIASLTTLIAADNFDKTLYTITESAKIETVLNTMTSEEIENQFLAVFKNLEDKLITPLLVENPDYASLYKNFKSFTNSTTDLSDFQWSNKTGYSAILTQADYEKVITEMTTISNENTLAFDFLDFKTIYTNILKLLNDQYQKDKAKVEEVTADDNLNTYFSYDFPKHNYAIIKDGVRTFFDWRFYSKDLMHGVIKQEVRINNKYGLKLEATDYKVEKTTRGDNEVLLPVMYNKLTLGNYVKDEFKLTLNNIINRVLTPEQTIEHIIKTFFTKEELTEDSFYTLINSEPVLTYDNVEQTDLTLLPDVQQVIADLGLTIEEIKVNTDEDFTKNHDYKIIKNTVKIKFKNLTDIENYNPSIVTFYINNLDYKTALLKKAPELLPAIKEDAKFTGFTELNSENATKYFEIKNTDERYNYTLEKVSLASTTTNEDEVYFVHNVTVNLTDDETYKRSYTITSEPFSKQKFFEQHQPTNPEPQPSDPVVVNPIKDKNTLDTDSLKDEDLNYFRATQNEAHSTMRSSYGELFAKQLSEHKSEIELTYKISVAQTLVKSEIESVDEIKDEHKNSVLLDFRTTYISNLMQLYSANNTAAAIQESTKNAFEFAKKEMVEKLVEAGIDPSSASSLFKNLSESEAKVIDSLTSSLEGYKLKEFVDNALPVAALWSNGDIDAQQALKLLETIANINTSNFKKVADYAVVVSRYVGIGVLGAISALALIVAFRGRITKGLKMKLNRNTVRTFAYAIATFSAGGIVILALLIAGIL